MSDNEKTANAHSMRTRGGGGMAANLKELKRSQSAQEEGSSPNANVVGKKRIEEPLSVRMELVELVAKNYAILTGTDNQEKNTAWQSIYDACAKLKHPWTVGQDSNYLRRSKWPNIKRDAMRHLHAYRTGNTELLTDVDRVIIGFVLENGNELLAEAEGRIADGGKVQKATKNLKKAQNNEEAAVNGKKTDDEEEAAQENKVNTRTRRQLRNSPVNTATAPIITPPQSRQSSQKASSVAESNITTAAAMPAPAVNRRAAKRRASAADLNTTASNSSNANAGAAQQDGEGGLMMMSALEKQLVQAKIRLSEAKIRLSEAKVHVNEEESNVNRLQQQLWKEMLRSGKKPANLGL